MISWDNVLTYYSGSGLDTLAIDSTGAATQDGSELIAAVYNNGIFGPQQALMDYAGLTPDGVTEAKGTAQILEAITKGWGVGPGKGVMWWLADDPAVTGDRVLLLEGQGVLIASYPELDAAVYVGDVDNAARAAAGGGFYHASDAAGTTPDTAGPYLILPDMRGYVPRGLDTAAAVDPDGASRVLGDVQLDAFQGWQLGFPGTTAYYAYGTNAYLNDITSTVATDGALRLNSASQGGTRYVRAMSDGTNGNPRTDSETRMTNVSTKFGIGY